MKAVADTCNLTDYQIAVSIDFIGNSSKNVYIAGAFCFYEIPYILAISKVALLYSGQQANWSDQDSINKSNFCSLPKNVFHCASATL